MERRMEWWDKESEKKKIEVEKVKDEARKRKPGWKKMVQEMEKKNDTEEEMKEEV